MIEVENGDFEIDFSAEGINEIAQNIKMILNTPKGSLPLDRDFGVDWSIVDVPNTKAFYKLKADIVKQIEKYEPRVKILGISVVDSESAADGIYRVKIRFEVNL